MLHHFLHCKQHLNISKKPVVRIRKTKYIVIGVWAPLGRLQIEDSFIYAALLNGLMCLNALIMECHRVQFWGHCYIQSM